MIKLILFGFILYYFISISNAEDCSYCMEKKQIYCIIDGTNKCIDGNFWGPPGPFLDFDKKICTRFYWKQCAVEGRVFFFIITLGSAVFVIIIIICACKLRKCCRRSPKIDDSSSVALLEANRRESGLVERDPVPNSKTPKNDAKRKEMENKYGIRSKSTS